MDPFKTILEMNNRSQLTEIATQTFSDISELKSVAHRGYSATAPENTLPSFELAATNGYKYVECDVRFTKDGIPVLSHNAAIDDCSDGSGNVVDLTLAELKVYDFGNWKDVAYVNTPIPTFDEFMALCKKLKLHAYIEIKPSPITSAQAATLTDIVKKHGLLRNVSWISFNKTDLAEILAIDNSARVGCICSTITPTIIASTLALKTGTNKVFIDGDYTAITNTLVDSVLASEIPLEVYTVNSALFGYSMVKKGISGITTDGTVTEAAIGALKETLIGYWKMNETEGTSVADSSGNAYNGTIAGTPTFAEGLLSTSGGAIAGNGTDTCIATTANLSSKSNFKIEFYFKKNSEVTGWRQLVNQYRNAGGGGVGVYIGYYGTAPLGIHAKFVTVSGNTGDTVGNSLYTTFNPAVGAVCKAVLEYDGIYGTFKIYSVSAGVLTEVANVSKALSGNLNASILPINFLASNASTPGEFAPFTIGEVKITTIA